MTLITDTRERPRRGLDAIRSIIRDRYGVVRVDSTQTYGPLTGESQTITSVRTINNDVDPYWHTYSRSFKEHLRKQRKIKNMLKRWNRRTNPNPCLIQKSVTTCSKDRTVEYLTGKTYPYCMISGNQAKWALMSNTGLTPWIGPITSYEQRFIDNSILKAYAKANSPTMPGLVYLGELGETLKMLKNPFSGIRSFLKRMNSHAKTRVRKGLSNTASSIADQWLEYRYGILPLMAQVDEICEAFGKRIIFGYPIKLTRDGLRIVSEKHRRYNNAKCSPTYTYGDYRLSEWKEIGAFCTLAHNLQMDEGKFFGLRPRDILPTIWELVPYSFVVDWMFNVGDWLEAIQPNPRLNVKSTSISLKRTVKYKLHLLNSGYGPDVYGRRVCEDYCETTEERLDRLINIPKPVFPVFNEDFLKYQRVLDSIALSYGKLRRTFRALR